MASTALLKALDAQALTAFLREQIPLTAAQQVTVELYQPGLIRIAVPLHPNRNYRGVGFGGALASLAIVSGWALVRQSVLEAGLDGHPVVQHSDCRFLRPATSDFVAESRLPGAEEWSRFLDALRTAGRGRVLIETTLSSAGKEVVQHRGTFAVAV